MFPIVVRFIGSTALFLKLVAFFLPSAHLTRMETFKLVGIGLIAVSLVFDVLGVLLFQRAKAKQARATKVMARIVDVVSVQTDSGQLWSPVWEATSPLGATVRAQASVATSRKPTIGAQEEVLYLADAEPQLFEAGLKGLFMPIVLLCMGGGLFVFGVVFTQLR